MVGSDVDVSADGLAKGEDYTVRLNGKPIMTGKADKKGDVARTFELAKTTPEGRAAADHHRQQPATGSARPCST